MIMYLTINYLFVAVMCIAGQFNRSFNGNSLQRTGLLLGALWAIWRVQLISAGTWSYPHEPLISTAMGLFALGTLIKTRGYCNRRKRAAKYLRNKRHTDNDRPIDRFRGYAFAVVVFFKCLANQLKLLISRIKKRK